jgi:hypothetical protein
MCKGATEALEDTKEREERTVAGGLMATSVDSRVDSLPMVPAFIATDGIQPCYKRETAIEEPFIGVPKGVCRKIERRLQ